MRFFYRQIQKIEFCENINLLGFQKETKIKNFSNFSIVFSSCFDTFLDGTYLFIEGSNPQDTGDYAVLLSPKKKIPVGRTFCLSFW